MTSMTWKRTLLLCLAAALSLVGSNAVEMPKTDDYESAYQRLQQLEGHWRGVLEEQGREAYAEYRMTGGGSALIETFGKEKQGSMSTVYHLDGNDLRLTHYCGAKNQPRMKAVAYDSSSGVIRFDFVDVTNLSAPDAYYTRQVVLTLKNKNHIEVKFSGLRHGEELVSTYTLTRVGD